jgi:hypothetical protein
MVLPIVYQARAPIYGCEGRVTLIGFSNRRKDYGLETLDDLRR